MLLILLKLNLTVFSQTDTSKINEPVKCLPVSILKKVTEDLLKGDLYKIELDLSNKEIIKLEEKIILKDSLINIFIIKEDNNKLIIDNLNQKINLLEKHNVSLSSELKKEKSKNKFKKFINNTIVGILVTLLIIK